MKPLATGFYLVGLLANTFLDNIVIIEIVHFVSMFGLFSIIAIDKQLKTKP